MNKNEISIIKVENLYKAYKIGQTQLQALKDINLQILKAEFVAIMGPSGSGKSTFISIAGGLDQPSKGTCWINGYEISNLNNDSLAKIRNKEVGFVFQNFNLLPRLNVVENVGLPLLYSELPFVERYKLTLKAVHLVNLDKRILHLPAELSGGEKQRVAIARALINNPSIIFADEPTGNLDSKTGREIMQIFSDLNQQGVTIVVITHDPAVAKYARRIIHFYDGRIQTEESKGSSSDEK